MAYTCKNHQVNMSVQYRFTSHFLYSLGIQGISIFLIFDQKHIYTSVVVLFVLCVGV